MTLLGGAMIITGMQRGVSNFLRIVPRELHDKFEINPHDLLRRGGRLLDEMRP